jgi:secondary thiamine-phosphate synthase enzyme
MARRWPTPVPGRQVCRMPGWCRRVRERRRDRGDPGHEVDCQHPSARSTVSAGVAATTGGTLSITAIQRRFTYRLPAEYGPQDVTSEVEQLTLESGVRTGVAIIQLVGSTGAVTTIEYEAGALADLRRALDLVVPVDARYEHNARWGDGNGFSHIRSALLKTSISVPVIEGQLALGTWQQIVIINLDNRARSREMVVVVLGERD